MGPLTVVAPQSRKFFSGTRAGTLRNLSVWLSAKIDEQPVLAFLAVTVFYAVAVLGLSSIKLLWLDELITLHIARLGNIGAIWHALAQGADPNPPLTDILVHLCRSVFGEREFALRLPAMAGYWLGMLSLYLFLRNRLTATWALGGVVLSMTMAAFDYSYESRSYGIFYGLCMVAVLCWSRAVDPVSSRIRRRLSLLGMALALAAGISTNYFAVLAFLPIAAGELTRTYRRAVEWRRMEFNPRDLWRNFLRVIDLPVWILFLVAAAPLLAFRSLIAVSIAEFAPYAWNKVSLGQVSDAYTQMVEGMLYPLLALFLFYLAIRWVGRFCSGCRASIRPRWIGRLATNARPARPSLPVHETAAIVFLMGYPILGYLVASMHGGMLSGRFVIPVCLGFAMAGVLAAYRIFRHLPGAGALFLCACAVWFIGRESVVGYWYMEQRQSFFKVVDALPEAERAVEPGAPIVIADPLMALTFRHYAPANQAARVVFPVDFPAIRLYRGDDSPEENLWAGRNSLYRIPIVPLAVFQRSASEYLILASDENWMIEDLLHHRYPIQRLPINSRAGAIGGFTPLSHATPVFYTSVGDAYVRAHPAVVPISFKAAKNLPSGKLTPAEGGPFEDSKR